MSPSDIVKRLAATFAVASAVYTLSFGPVASYYLINRGRHWRLPLIRVLYAPIIWAGNAVPIIGDVEGAYLDFWGYTVYGNPRE